MGKLSRCLRDENIVAVMPAPAAADTPAMIDNLVFDMLVAGGQVGHALGGRFPRGQIDV